jgi:hypothetical protein
MVERRHENRAHAAAGRSESVAVVEPADDDLDGGRSRSRTRVGMPALTSARTTALPVVPLAPVTSTGRLSSFIECLAINGLTFSRSGSHN